MTIFKLLKFITGECVHNKPVLIFRRKDFILIDFDIVQKWRSHSRGRGSTKTWQKWVVYLVNIAWRKGSKILKNSVIITSGRHLWTAAFYEKKMINWKKHTLELHMFQSKRHFCYNFIFKSKFKFNEKVLCIH